MVELAGALDALYGGDPDAFVATRKDLVAGARAAKDRDLATEIQALRRPTRSAWMVNLLARSRPDELGQLLELGPALSAAHTGGSTSDLRQLSALRRQAIDALIRLARDLARDAGYDPPTSALTEVHTTLDAALTHHEVGRAVAAGVLTRAPESAASFPTELFAPLADVVPFPSHRTRKAGSDAESEEAPEDTEAQEAAREAEARARAVAEAERAVATAERRHGEARKAADRARDAHDSATTAVAELEQRLEHARASASEATARLTDVDRAAERSEEQLNEAKARLADLSEE